MLHPVWRQPRSPWWSGCCILSDVSQGHLDGLGVASCLTPNKVTLMVWVLHPVWHQPRSPWWSRCCIHSDARQGHLDGLGVASCLTLAKVTLMVWVLHPVWRQTRRPWWSKNAPLVLKIVWEFFQCTNTAVLDRSATIAYLMVFCTFSSANRLLRTRF